jgi:hypothetical protein
VLGEHGLAPAVSSPVSAKERAEPSLTSTNPAS